MPLGISGCVHFFVVHSTHTHVCDKWSTNIPLNESIFTFDITTTIDIQKTIDEVVFIVAKCDFDRNSRWRKADGWMDWFFQVNIPLFVSFKANIAELKYILKIKGYMLYEIISYYSNDVLNNQISVKPENTIYRKLKPICICTHHRALRLTRW